MVRRGMQGWRDDVDRRLWESMVETHHPAGWPGSIPQGGGRCPEPKSSGRGSRSRQTPSSA